MMKFYFVPLDKYPMSYIIYIHENGNYYFYNHRYMKAQHYHELDWFIKGHIPYDLIEIKLK